MAGDDPRSPIDMRALLLDAVAAVEIAEYNPDEPDAVGAVAEKYGLSPVEFLTCMKLELEDRAAALRDITDVTEEALQEFSVFVRLANARAESIWKDDREDEDS
jgi:hypothetical protein